MRRTGAKHVTYTHSSFMADGRAFGDLTINCSLYHDNRTAKDGWIGSNDGIS